MATPPPTNLSLYTVPLAWILALSPRVYSMLTYATFSSNPQIKRDAPHVHVPRTFTTIALSDSTLPALYQQRIIRAESASLNGIENLGLFAAAVAVGNWAGVDVRVLNWMSVGYLLSRVVYNVIFVRWNDTNRWVWLRTTVFMVGLLDCLGVFVLAGRKVNAGV